VLKGKHQVFWWGWLADYPDAENFLFLLYGPNAKSLHNGENTANWQNPEFDRLYRQMQVLDNGPEKQRLIDQMVKVAQEDAPWAWGYFPYAGVAFQPWVHNGKPTVVVNDKALYWRVDPKLREQRQAEWNRPVAWPLAALVLLALALLGAARRSWKARERITATPVGQGQGR
jgi:hypothetical protein